MGIIGDATMQALRRREARRNPLLTLRVEPLPPDMSARRDELAQRIHDDAGRVSRQVTEKQEAWLASLAAAGVDLRDYVLEYGPLQTAQMRTEDDVWHLRATQTVRLKRRDEAPSSEA